MLNVKDKSLRKHKNILGVWWEEIMANVVAYF